MTELVIGPWCQPPNLTFEQHSNVVMSVHSQIGTHPDKKLDVCVKLCYLPITINCMDLLFNSHYKVKVAYKVIQPIWLLLLMGLGAKVLPGYKRKSSIISINETWAVQQNHKDSDVIPDNLVHNMSFPRLQSLCVHSTISRSAGQTMMGVWEGLFVVALHPSNILATS